MTPLSKENGRAIHQPAPTFDTLSTSAEPLYTGIKVIDLLEPYAKQIAQAKKQALQVKG